MENLGPNSTMNFRISAGESLENAPCSDEGSQSLQLGKDRSIIIECGGFAPNTKNKL